MSEAESYPHAHATMCIDVATRTVLGVHIANEPPSSASALLALKQMLERVRPRDAWGIPDQMIVEIDSALISPSLLHALADLDDGGSRKRNPKS